MTDIILQLGGIGGSVDYGSLLGTSVWLMLGICIGFGGVVWAAGNSDSINDMLLRNILRGNKEGWTIVQRGNNYELEPLERDKDANAYHTDEDEEEAEWFSDPGDQMLSWYGVPVGLALEGQRPMIDVETATAAHRASEQSTDGGELQTQTAYNINDIQEKLVVGSLATEQGVVQYINPYVDIPRRRFVDLRNLTKILRYDAGSDVPRKTAKNAVEAEQALTSDYGDLKEFGKIITAFMLGAIATYIGVTGGGGGGGGVNIMVHAAGVLL